MIVALVPVSPIADAAWAAKQQREAVGAGDVAQQHRRRKHGGVADAVDREHTQRVRHRRGPLVKERDEQRRAEPDELPADEEHLDVARQRHEQHARDEHRQQDEIPVVAGLAVQIAIRKCRHDAGDGRRERREREREPIDQEFDRDAAFVRRRPVRRTKKPRARSGRAVDDERRRQGGARDRHRAGGEPARPSLGQRPIERATRRPAARTAPPAIPRRRAPSTSRGRFASCRVPRARARCSTVDGRGTIATGGRKPRLP